MPPRRDPAKPSNAMPKNRLGIFVRSPGAGEVNTRLHPALTASRARDLYLAFLVDLCARVRESKHRPTIFLAGEPVAELASALDPHWEIVAQADGTLGDRLTAAFAHLLRSPADRAVIIGSDSPDLPLPYLKRAFQSLKHRDVVVGPSVDGGYYLMGLRRTTPALFRDIAWGTPSVLAETLSAIEREGLTLALAPPWYDVGNAASLRFFAALVRARRASGTGRLRQCELALAALSGE